MDGIGIITTKIFTTFITLLMLMLNVKIKIDYWLTQIYNINLTNLTIGIQTHKNKGFFYELLMTKNGC